MKEKVLAAHRAGIKTILLPERNKLDIDEIPKSVLKEGSMEFHFVKEMSQVLELALLPKQGVKDMLPTLEVVSDN